MSIAENTAFVWDCQTHEYDADTIRARHVARSLPQ